MQTSLAVGEAEKKIGKAALTMRKLWVSIQFIFMMHTANIFSMHDFIKMGVAYK